MELVDGGIRSAAVLTFGVTGHRDIPPDDRDSLRRHFSQIFREYVEAMPSTSFLLITALADGADQIAADVALTMPRFEVVAALPMPLDDYLADFPGENSRSLLELLGRCDGRLDTSRFHEHLRPEVPSERIALYQVCGRWISDNCHALLAAWNGQAPAHVGGTADIVYYRVDALEPLLSPHASAGLNRNDSRLVLWCPTRRGQALHSTSDQADIQIVRKGGESEAWLGISDESARSVDDFNRLSQLTLRSAEASQELYEAADLLASRLQKQYRRLVKAVTVSGMATLLCIDAMQTTNDLRLAVALGGFAVLTAGLMLLLYRARLKTRFQQARYLAECCRVQLVWLACGLPRSPVYFLIDGVGSSGAWIRASLRAAWILDSTRAREIPNLSKAEIWLKEQLAYFLGTKTQDGAISRMQRRHLVIQRGAWFLIVLAILAVGAEIAMMIVGTAPDTPSRQVVGLIWALGIGGGVGLFTYGELMGYGELSRRYALLVPSLQEAAAALAKSTSVEESTAVIQDAGLAALQESGDWLALHSQQHVRPLW